MVRSRNTRAKPQPFPFERLPAEIRFLVYEYIFEPEEHDIKLMMEVHPSEDWRNGRNWVTDNQWNHHTAIDQLQKTLTPGNFAYQQKTPAILLVSKDIYKEAAPVFHRCRTIYFGGSPDLVKTLRKATDEQIAQVHRVRLMQRRLNLKGERDIRGLPNGDVTDWHDLTIPVLSECRNLQHLTVDLGFFWSSMEHSQQLNSLRNLRGLQSLTFLGNDGQPTIRPKWGYVLHHGVRPDLHAQCTARVLPEFKFYEVNPNWIKSIRADAKQERQNDYDFRRRYRLSQ
jgi:hypothetical protein